MSRIHWDDLSFGAQLALREGLHMVGTECMTPDAIAQIDGIRHGSLIVEGYPDGITIPASRERSAPAADASDDAKIECESCGRMNASDAKFCARCGAELDDDDEKAAAMFPHLRRAVRQLPEPESAPAPKSYAEEMLPRSLFDRTSAPASGSPWGAEDAAERAALLAKAPPEQRRWLESMPLDMLRANVKGSSK